MLNEINNTSDSWTDFAMLLAWLWSFEEPVAFLEQFFVEDDPPFRLEGSVVDHVQRAFVGEVFWNVGARRFFGLKQSELLVECSYQLGTEICPVFLFLLVLAHYLVEAQQFTKRKPVLLVQVGLHKLLDSFVEVLRLVLHIKSAPVDAFDVLKPLVAYELIPHGKWDSSAWIGLEDAKAILLVLEDHPNMVAFWVGEKSLHLGKGMIVSEEQHVSSLAVFGELLLSRITILKLTIPLHCKTNPGLAVPCSAICTISPCMLKSKPWWPWQCCQRYEHIIFAFPGDYWVQ